MIDIPLSRIGSEKEFAAVLEAYRATLESHVSGEPDVPAPVHEHELVERLIARVPAKGPAATRGPDSFVILPWRIVDDTPKPPTLAERKAALLTALHAASDAARDAALSPARQHLLHIEAAEALAVEADKRSKAQAATAAQFAAFNDGCAALRKTAARAAVEIEDLTEASIGAWKLPAF